MQTTVPAVMPAIDRTSPFMELCGQRQSCRSFSDQPVAHETLLRVVEAARLAPSACNSQPWRFILVETPELVERIAPCGQVMGINGFLKEAKSILLILETPAKLAPVIASLIDGQHFAKGDVGGAALAACFAAAEQGLGSCIIGLFDRPKIREILELPPETKIDYFIALGYPKNIAVRAKSRKGLDELLTTV
ncbi:MAG: nitroreductase family protein [Oscillospiraceae bacterium]|jgi:nitroreductase|nr:nitroreductase family protein [Oscillospiraceae bacterium]